LSTVLDFRHDSIPECQKMVADLGKLDPNNQWTTQIETDDLVDFTDAGLKPFGMLFWCSPTGTVFSNNPKVKDKAVAMKALQTYVEGGGAWGGVHSATDFEKSNGFPWFTNTLTGAYFVDHDPDGTAGTVQVQSTFTSHPVMKGLSSAYSTQDEWYKMNRDVSAQPGFQILARLAKDNRPLVWVKEIMNGRMFYTVRGHNKTVFAEKEYRTLVQNGIMWATRRVN
jgi:type 1 glutamine amidotransferase